MSAWPNHPDGRPMMLGEMSPEQRRERAHKAVKRIQVELRRNAPAIAEALASFDAREDAERPRENNTFDIPTTGA